MVTRRKKKSRKHRGGRTHGWGFGKRHRGKGHKPYRGSGVGKRGAHRETLYYSKGAEPIGKHGMQVLPMVSVTEKTINLKELEENLPRLLAAKVIEKKSDAYVIDLNKLGYAKLLSEGSVKNKMQITCRNCSAKAKEKVESAGGSITQ
jgi:large subunit ribosomal protein L15